jgi:hypothetical protein
MARAGADVLADADLLTPAPLPAEISRLAGQPCEASALPRVKATKN